MFIFQRKMQKWVTGLCLTLLLFVQLGVTFYPEPVHAQLVVSNPAEVAKWSTDAILQGVLASSLGALVNGFSYFMRKVAYDTATYIASGGKGQGALAFQQGAGSYFKSVALDSTATAIEQFGSPFGLNLCKPPDLKFQILLQVGVRKLYADPAQHGGPQPKCGWNSFQSSWKNAPEKFSSQAGDIVSQGFANALKVNQTDFGISLNLLQKVDRINAQEQYGAQASRIEGNGFKAVTDLISGNIKTPASLVKEESDVLSNKNQLQNTSQQVAGIYGAGLWQVIPAAAGVFLNTLTSQLMESILSKGIIPDASTGNGKTGAAAQGVASEFSSVINDNRELAQNAFNFLFTAVPTQELSVYPLMEEFNDCPSTPGLNNCVADAGLVKGIKLASTGRPLTIQEAMDPKNSVLHPNWPLIPPTREIDNVLDKKSGSHCFQQKYCYSNLQKLRKARILPLGFEIAALKADPDKPEDWTLEKVVRGFEDCNPATGLSDAQHPFCHLIDPNWVIRLPEPRCESKVFGPNLLTDNNPARRQECVDVSTCIAEDEQGHCLGNYGYCLKEKNTWRLAGNSCPSQFNTCKTYLSDKDNTTVSYLSRTLDYGQCNQQSIGCRSYSLEPKVGGGWHSSGEPVDYAKETLTGRNPTVFLNDSIKNYQCDVAAEGCSALFRANSDATKGGTLYFKKAPGPLFASCYLVNNANGDGVWPSSASDLATLSSRPEAATCKPFANACIKDEAGCETYTPADGSGNTVTGIVGSNSCPAQCIGYDTFKQEEPEKGGVFEPAVFPLHFIATQAKECPSQSLYEGCSEFTNIDAGASGEKIETYSDLQYCEKPNGKNEQTYYSWEGSVNQGYVLNVHKLLSVSTDPSLRYNSAYINKLDFTPEVSVAVSNVMKSSFSVGPAYVDDSKEPLISNYSDCNAVTYQAALQNPYGTTVAKPDCRALYDDKGTVYYRLLSKTITVSPACHPLRKTESFLRDEPALSGISNGESCLAKGGDWNPTTNSCRLCYNGGIFNNGSCIYWTTSRPGEAKSCPVEAVNCRAYTGPAANNVHTILDQKFEPINTSDSALLDAKDGWSGGTIKPESIVTGQNSLQIDQAVIDYRFASDTLEKNKFYQLEFWARGNPQNLTVSFLDKDANGAIVGDLTLDPVTSQTVQAPIGATWQQYRLGPVQFTGDGSHAIVLHFSRTIVGGAVSGPYYLDNLALIKVTDKLFLIKNSWKQTVTTPDGHTIQADVPLSCDPNPQDNFPGAALGCKAYTDSFDNATSTVGFDRLCRPEAAGCTAVYDSQNTLQDEGAVGYNLWCKGEGGKPCTLSIGTEQIGSCNVPIGEVGCYLPKSNLSDDAIQSLKTNKTLGALTNSSVIIPADTPSTTPLYLTYQKTFAASCSQENIGCQKVALEEQVLPTSTSSGSYQFSEYSYKNNPDKYDQILCSQESVGCGQFKSGNTVTYFKDPKATGGKSCVYKDQVEVNGGKVSGWFKDGVGNCKAKKDSLCKQDSDCATGDVCENVGAVACYPNYQMSGGDYGIWSNKSANYTGAVGVCPSEYNQCAELVDPEETNNKGDEPGKSYYVIFDSNLQNSAKGCDGKASLKDGCVLFDQTENPNKLYDAKATYVAAGKVTPKFGPVDLVSSVDHPENNNANVLLKVEHNRECSEWLSCKNTVSVQNDNNEEQKVCYEYKSCRKLNGILECSDWSDSSYQVTSPLTEDTYTGRSTDWYGEDYSGYSLYNKYPISSITYVSTKGDAAHYAAYEMNDFTFGAQALKFGCKGNGKVDWAMCGFDNGGRCYKNKCIYPLDGSFSKNISTPAQAVTALIGPSCKGYPEAIAPFDRNVAASDENNNLALNPAAPGQPVRYDFKIKSPGYEKANVCQEGACSCDYKKVTYKSSPSPDFWPANKVNTPSGICLGGNKDGSACVTDENCSNSQGGSGGVCAAQESVETHQGLLGTCLEYDLSRPIISGNKKEFPCLTWLPINTAASGLDPYGNKQKAGYYPAIDAVTTNSANNTQVVAGSVYCRNATANVFGAYDKRYFTYIISQLTSSLCLGNSSEFSCNQNIYKALFNSHGDYIFDDTAMVGIVNDSSDPNNKDVKRAYEIAAVKDTFQPPYRTLITKMNDPFNAAWACHITSHKDYYYSMVSSLVTGVEASCGYNLGFPIVTDGDVLHGATQSDKNIFLGPGQGVNGYVKRIYSLMQMWAWYGGMYGRGTALEVSKPAPFAILDLPELVDCDKEFPVTGGTPKQNLENSFYNTDCKAQNNNKLNAVKDNLKKQINKVAPDPKVETVDEIKYPNAVVLFTSSLYFRDYLFTSLREVDQYSSYATVSTTANKIQVYYEKRPLHEGNYKELSYVPSVYSEPGQWTKSVLPLSNSLKDGATDAPFFRSNNRVSKNPKEYNNTQGYDPVFANYESSYKLYEQEISKLHYGPLISPTTLKGAGDMLNSVLTIDFNNLKNQKPELLKTSHTGIEYELQKSSDAAHGIYNFRIHPLTGDTWKDKIIYVGYAVSPNITGADDPLSVFKEDLDHQAGDNQATAFADGFKWQQDAQNERSAVAVYIRFDEYGMMEIDHPFKNQYAARYRDDSLSQVYDGEFKNHDGQTPYLAVTAELSPRCAEYGIVYNNNPVPGERTDKAWTDRLWGYSGYDVGNNDLTGVGKVKRSTSLAPYGSTQLSATSFAVSEKVYPNSGATSLWQEARRHYIFSDPAFDGIMYNCNAPVLEPYNDPGYLSNEGKMGLEEPQSSWPYAYSALNNNSQTGTSTYYGCAGTSGNGVYNYIAPSNTKSIPFQKDYIFDYFAAYYQIVKNSQQNTGWSVSAPWFDPKTVITPQATLDFASGIYDISGDASVATQGIPPQIYSLDLTSCYVSATKKVDCLPGEKNNVTVNRRNGVANDYNGDGIPDDDTAAIVGNGSLSATMQFFAFADHNRMPINRIMIDWGDNDIMNADNYGKYQNHKPFCIAAGSEGTPDISECASNKQLTCHTDSDCPATASGAADKCNQSAKHFGDSARACYPKYFEFFHGYSCNKTTIQLNSTLKGTSPNGTGLDYVVDFANLLPAEKDQLNLLGYTNANTQQVCKFVPRVQVLDNWGWCNGSCSGGNGCYSKKTISGGSFNQCEPSDILDQWSQFKGTIIVVPSK